MRDSMTCKGRHGKPLKEYDSEQEALEAAEYVKQQYGNDTAPYKCGKCGKFHLSPKDRQTPNIKCGCLDSDGAPKNAYATRKDAEARAKIILEERRISLSVYECPHSQGWHLTSKYA